MLALASCSFTAANATLLFDRGLPEKNLNNAAGADRSNVAWTEGVLDTLLGDTYTLGGSGTYHVDTIRVWVVGESKDLVLWGGAEGALTQLSSTAVSTAVKYLGGEEYQGSSGSFIQMYQIDFAVDMFVNGGDTQYFFLQGTTPVNVNYNPFMHASNAALSGSTQQGADDLMYSAKLSGGNLSGVASWTSAGNGWDKASDFNVQVLGERAVPGPAAIVPFAVGLLAAAKRRRK